MPDSDLVNEAIRRFQAGEDREGSFRFLYETYFPDIERFFKRKGVLSPEDRLDLTQKTFLGIYRGMDSYEHRQQFTAWLYRAAKTTWLKWWRSLKTAKRDAVVVSHDAPENLDSRLAVPAPQLDNLIEEERRRGLQAAVAELPKQMRDCMILRYYHQLSYSEIAVIKKISVETVKAHLHKAKKKLQEKLGDFDLGDLED